VLLLVERVRYLPEDRLRPMLDLVERIRCMLTKLLDALER
jgi:hypothetical protein